MWFIRSLSKPRGAPKSVGVARSIKMPSLSALTSACTSSLMAWGGVRQAMAAALAVDAIEEFYLDGGATWPSDANGPVSDPRAFLVAAVKHANTRIRQHAAQHPEHAGLGAAVAVVQTSGAQLCIAHVGHVRGYRLRDGVLVGLTEDHTQLNHALWAGVAYHVAERHRDAQALSRALGLHPRVQVTTRVDDVRAGDLVALVSNVLYRAMSDWQLWRILSSQSTLNAIATHLICIAQAHDAADDISCVLLRWVAGEEAPQVAA